MTHVDARAIARVAHNPACRRQAAMVLLGLPNGAGRALDASHSRPRPGEERTAALRWGTLFDHRLTEHGATRLLSALDGLLGINAATASVRDLRAEIPGRSGQASGERNRRVRAVLADLLAGEPVPDVLIQPPLRLTWGRRAWGAIVPDALVLDRARRTFVPLEAKGHVTLDGVAPAGERGWMRLQAAVQIHALHAELRRLHETAPVSSQALLVMATPFGFRPAPAVLEELGAEVEAVSAALHTLEQTSSGLVHQGDNLPPGQILPRMPPRFRESCWGGCAMAHVCQADAPGVRGVLGDRAASLIGPGLDLARLASLMDGVPPETLGDGAALSALADAAALFGWGG